MYYLLSKVKGSPCEVHYLLSKVKGSVVVPFGPSGTPNDQKFYLGPLGRPQKAPKGTLYIKK